MKTGKELILAVVRGLSRLCLPKLATLPLAFQHQGTAHSAIRWLVRQSLPFLTCLWDSKACLSLATNSQDSGPTLLLPVFFWLCFNCRPAKQHWDFFSVFTCDGRPGL